MNGKRIYSGSAFEEKAGYARAVVTDGWVFLAGTTGFDPETKAYPPTVEEQCENCFRTIAKALGEAGGGLEDLVRVVIYVGSREEFQRAMPIIKKHCWAARPANTTIIAELVGAEMRIEIEATARLKAN